MRETSYLTDNQRVLTLLKSIEKFSPFSDEDLLSFLDLGKLIEYQPGEAIIREGEKDTWIYFLLSGEVTVFKNGKKVHSLKRSGEILGEMGIIDGSPRSATIQAKEKSLLLGVDGNLVSQKHQENELAFGYTIFRLFAEILAQRLRLTTEENIRLKKELERITKG